MNRIFFENEESTVETVSEGFEATPIEDFGYAPNEDSIEGTIPAAPIAGIDAGEIGDLYVSGENGVVIETGETPVTGAVPDGAEESTVLIAEAPKAEKMPVGEAGVNAVLGYGVVFSGLLLLLAIVAVTGAIFKGLGKKKKAAKTEAPADIPAPAEAKPAPGTAGEVKLFDVPDKEAAMIMAIVADKLQKPLNELRFISIKEVK